MNEQYLSFRSLWITFDLHAVSIGLWVYALLLIETLLIISGLTELNKKSVLYPLGRLLLCFLPFKLLSETDVTSLNYAVGAILIISYLFELKKHKVSLCN